MADTKTVQKSVDLRRAEHALKAIHGVDKICAGKYRSYVKEFPAEILQMGLGQAVATHLAAAGASADSAKADKQAHRTLGEQLQAWLCGTDPAAPYAGKSQLIDAIVAGDERAYLRAQAEALAYLVWLKKFAVAFIDAPNGDVP